MKISRKRIFLTVSAVGVFVLLLIAATDDNHVTNAQYLFWKWGLAPSQYKVGLQYLNVDNDFRQSLNGKTLPEVHKLFPVLEKPSQCSDWRKEWDVDNKMTDKDARWIDDTNWAITFHDGRITDLIMCKG